MQKMGFFTKKPLSYQRLSYLQISGFSIFSRFLAIKIGAKTGKKRAKIGPPEMGALRSGGPPGGSGQKAGLGLCRSAHLE